MKTPEKIIISGVLISLTIVGSIYVLNPTGTSSSDLRARVFGFMTYRIPNRAMLPTLQVGDFILVNSGAYSSNHPERNDIIVFKLPGNEKLEYVIKSGGEKRR